MDKKQTPPEVLKAPEWNPSMGKVPYHYADKPIGSRCLWAVRWNVSFEADPNSMRPSKKNHLVSINEWERAGWELPNMSDEQIRCELEDVSARPIELAPKATQLLFDSYPDKAHWRYTAEALLFSVRPGYPEAVAPWAEPETPLHNRTVRPGWESWEGKRKAEIIKVSIRSKRR